MIEHLTRSLERAFEHDWCGREAAVLRTRSRTTRPRPGRPGGARRPSRLTEPGSIGGETTQGPVAGGRLRRGPRHRHRMAISVYG
jgi:hypothetical protein